MKATQIARAAPKADVFALIDRGFASHADADYAAASAAAQEILAVEPAQVDALYLSGLIAMAREDFVAAEDWFERAILAKGDFSDPYIALLGLLQRQDRKEDFGAVYELAKARLPAAPQTATQLANLLVAQDPERAVVEFDAALAAGGSIESTAGRLRALVALGRASEAAEEAREVWRANPRGIEPTALLGITLVESEAFDEAEQVLTQGLAEHPDNYAFHYDLALALHRKGDDTAFALRVDQLLKRFPEDAQAEFLLAFRDLARGRFDQGFARYESRKRLPGAHLVQSAPIPEWRGEPLDGKRLLVIDEQGYGDNLMFARFLSRLLDAGIQVTYLCPEALYALFAWEPALRRARILKRQATPQWEEGDTYVPIMSLPHLLGVRHPSRDVRFPYLTAPIDLSSAWHERIDDDGRLKVGVAWAANPRQSVGRERSVPWGILSRLLATPGVRFYSLQVGPGRLERSLPEIENLAPDLYDFADTFAAVSCLDLVITVDTSVAHVAGALGKPVWVMTPFLTDWRFAVDAKGAAWWYPQAKIFRQPTRGHWQEVIDAVRGELSRLAA